jgi:predicted sugar kinase
MNLKTFGVTEVSVSQNVSTKKCQNMVKKLCKCCQKIVKKIVKKTVKNLSKNCQKTIESFQKVFKKLSKIVKFFQTAGKKYYFS